MKAHEQRRRKKHELRDQALHAQLYLNETLSTQSRGLGGTRQGGRGQGGRDRSGQGDWSKSEVECFRCGKYGHYARECISNSY